MMRSSKSLLVFDLDGTLADSRMDLVQAINFALSQVGLTNIPYAAIISFVGEGSRKLLARCFAHCNCQDQELFAQAEKIFLRYYYEHIRDHSQLYPGVAEVIAQLPSPKSVLSNKPTKMSCKLLDSLGIIQYFDEIIGGDFSEELKPNPHYLFKLMAKHGVTPATTWMIGDSPIDIATADNAKANSIAVGYGLYKPEELQKLHPTRFIASFSELLHVNF